MTQGATSPGPDPKPPAAAGPQTGLAATGLAAAGLAARGQATPPPAALAYRQALARLRPALWAVAGLSALVNLLMLTAPLYMLQVYDRVLSSGSVATLQGLFGLVIGLYLFLGLFDFLRSRILSRAAHRLDQDLGPMAFARWLRGDRDRLAPHPRQDMGQDMGQNPEMGREMGREMGPGQGLRALETLRSFLASPAPLALMDLPWVPFYGLVLFLVHPALGGLTLVGAAVVTLAALANQRLAAPGLAEAAQAETEERAFTDLTRRHSDLVAAHGMADRLVRRWQSLHARRLAAAQRAAERSEGVGAFSKTFRMFLQSAMLTLAAWLVLRQELSAGMIVASSVISGRALSPVDQTIAQWRMIGRALATHRESALLFGQGAALATTALPPPTGRIRLNAVTRMAPGAGTVMGKARLLDRVSFGLEPGDGLGVVGPSAAGKSVLGRILIGAWRPDAGEIRLDGATPEQWAPEDLGRHIGYLPQQAELLPGSIRDNIARFDPEAQEEQIFEAARIAGVHEMILALPQGYQTQAGPGCPLSGGQVQRLGLARAVFGLPKIVVLDEPNANLDQPGDEALRQAILALRALGSTVIVMAHRPSAIAAVNKMLVLQEGRVTAFGPRDQILPSLLGGGAGGAAQSGAQAAPHTAPPTGAQSGQQSGAQTGAYSGAYSGPPHSGPPHSGPPSSPHSPAAPHNPAAAWGTPPPVLRPGGSASLPARLRSARVEALQQASHPHAAGHTAGHAAGHSGANPGVARS